jgi:integrase
VATAGLARLTRHDVGHTTASLAIASDAPVNDVLRMLGHRDAAMTPNVYAPLLE